MNEEVRKIQKLYCRKALFYAICAFFIFYLLDEKAIGKGLVFGTLFSIFNFVLMGILLDKQIAGAEKRVRAGSKAFISIFIRFALLAIPLVISLKTEAFNFFGTAAGIFMVQFSILFNNLIVGRFSRIRKA